MKGGTKEGNMHKYTVYYKLQAINANGGHTTGHRTITRIAPWDAVAAVINLVGPLTVERLSADKKTLCPRCYGRPTDKGEVLRTAILGQCDTCAQEHDEMPQPLITPHIERQTSVERVPLLAFQRQLQRPAR